MLHQNRGNQRVQEVSGNFFQERPASEQAIYSGRLTELAAFQGERFHAHYEPEFLSKVQACINARLRKYGQLIQAPHGPAAIDFGYNDG